MEDGIYYNIVVVVVVVVVVVHKYEVRCSTERYYCGKLYKTNPIKIVVADLEVSFPVFLFIQNQH